MSEYVLDLRGNVIVDFVGRTENIAADFAEACERIGFPPTPLSHERKAARRRPYWEYYDGTTRRIVERHYERDLEMFGYRF